MKFPLSISRAWLEGSTTAEDVAAAAAYDWGAAATLVGLVDEVWDLHLNSESMHHLKGGKPPRIYYEGPDISAPGLSIYHEIRQF